MQLDVCQSRFVEEVLHGDTHVILTGKAGTGKSTALCAAVRSAKAAGFDVLVMAPTAMAASIHRDAGLESGTIHHALKWNPHRVPIQEKLLDVCSGRIDWVAPPDQRRLLVVDEASMVGLWLFEILARDLGDPVKPFDGRRLILVGDWAQLPPVVGDGEGGSKALIARFGPPDGCVLFHPLFTRRPPVAVILEETHRANGEWFEALNRLRECSATTPLASFGIRPKDYSGDEGSEGEAVHMCFRRVRAHARNQERLASLGGRAHNLRLRDGDTELKVGCKLIVSSNRAGEGYINGSRAIFAGLGPHGEPLLDDGRPVKWLADGNWGAFAPRGADGDNGNVAEGKIKAAWLRSRFGDQLEKEAADWLAKVELDDALAAAFSSGRVVCQPYVPLLPGYALTVHKAQGMTLPGVVIEEDVFWRMSPARLPYVALSRVADGGDAALAGFGAESVRIQPDGNYPGIMARLTKWARG